MAILATKSAANLAPEAKRLLQLLQSGRVRILTENDGFMLQAGNQKRPLPQPLLRELLRERLLVEDNAGGYRIAEQSERARPGFNAGESPLFRLRYRVDGKAAAYLNQQQFDAGERLRMDYERSDLGARITANWAAERVDGGSHATISDNRIAHVADSAIDARRRLHEAFDAVGPELSAVLYYVCCLAGGLEQAERYLALPPRSGKAILSLSLTRLARHYRMLGRPQPAARAGNLGHWALADYRPVIQPPGQPPARQT